MPNRWRRRQLVACLLALALASAFTLHEAALFFHTRQAKIVAAVEKLAGKSDAPKNARLDWLPFTLPVPDGAKYYAVGNARVYLDVAPDTSVVVRPTRQGVQAFMYITGPAAPSEYSFTFHLLPDTALARQDDGTVGMVDNQLHKTYPALEQPWAQSLGNKHRYTTTYTVKDATVTQAVSLTGAQYPLVADPGFDDPLTQLLEGRVPDLSAAQTATKDGPSHSMPFGRYYDGPNGLEIRMSQEGSVKAIEDAISVASTVSTVGAYKVLLTELGPIIAAAMAEKIDWAEGLSQAAKKQTTWLAPVLQGGYNIALNHISKEDLIRAYVLHNQCIAMTRVPGTVTTMPGPTSAL